MNCPLDDMLIMPPDLAKNIKKGVAFVKDNP